MLKIKLYVLDSGKLREKPLPAAPTTKDLDKHGYAWFDIDESKPEPIELRSFLLPFGLHPLVLDRCVWARRTHRE